MVESLAFIFFGQRFPVFPGGLQQGESAHYVGACERERVLDGAVNVALCRKVDDAVDPVVADDAAHLIEIGDVSLNERVVRSALNILKIGKVAGVCKLVKIYDMIVRVFVDKQPDNVRSDESGTTGDQYIPHRLCY